VRYLQGDTMNKVSIQSHGSCYTFKN